MVIASDDSITLGSGVSLSGMVAGGGVGGGVVRALRVGSGGGGGTEALRSRVPSGRVGGGAGDAAARGGERGSWV
jgi:hypothetical protein